MHLRPLARLLVALALFSLSAGAAAQDWIYPIRKGDTLWQLCLEYSNKPGCWVELGKYNDIDKDRRIPIGTQLRFPLAWLVRVPQVATVVALQGEVLYDARSDGDRQPATQGQGLLLGSSLVVKDGSATIRRDDGSEVLLRRGSTLRLDAMTTGITSGAASEMSLDDGELEVRVPRDKGSRFEVTTPSAIAAVRGTQYRLASLDAAATRGEVLAGAVAVAAGSEQVVEGGFGVLARKDEPVGEPRKLLAAPVFARPVADGPLPFTLRWEPERGAVLWRTDIYHLGRAGALVATVDSPLPAITLEELEQACYRFVVRAVDAEGFNGLPREAQACIKPAPVVEHKGDFWPGLVWAAGVMLLIAL